MAFYRVEYLMENWKNHNEKENKRQSEHESEEKAKYSPSSFQRQQDANMKKYMGNNNLGNFGAPKMPQMKLPKW
jgi:hypothetical protein